MTMKIIKLAGNPYERGVSQGRQCNNQIRSMVRFLGLGAVRFSMPDVREGHLKRRYWLDALVGYRSTKRRLLDLARSYEGIIKDFWPEAIDEMRGISDGADVDYHDVLLVNVLGELVNGCSIWAACGKATRSGQPLLGMNSDEEKASHRYEIIKIIEPTDGYRVVANSMAGWVFSNSGMNEKGLAMGWPMLWLRKDALPAVQMPAMVLQRPLYRCATVDEALGELSTLPEPALPTAQYVVDTTKVARIEWGRDDRDNTVLEDGVLANTNRPESERMSSRDATLEWDSKLTFNALTRQKRMGQLLEEHYGDFDVDTMKAIATDHGAGDTRGRSICQHSLHPMGVATVTSLIAEPTAKRVFISGCPPCKTGFDTVGV